MGIPIRRAEPDADEIQGLLDRSKMLLGYTQEPERCTSRMHDECTRTWDEIEEVLDRVKDTEYDKETWVRLRAHGLLWRGRLASGGGIN